MTAGPAVLLRDVFCLHRTDEGDAAALQGLSLELGPRERLCVIGPSGAGKTTLLRICAGLQAPSAGAVHVFGSELWRMPARDRDRLRQTHLGILGQHAERALAPDLTAAQAIALPLALRGIARRTARRRADELLSACALRDRARARPHELSGGERQRVALCAALAHRPRLLLADEPTAELDREAASGLADLIEGLARADGTALLLVSHDPALAGAAQRAVRLHDGRIASERAEGPPALAVDRGGWVRLPGALRREAGVGPTVRARARAREVVLTPTVVDAAAPAPEPVPDIPPPASSATVTVHAVHRERGEGRVRRIALAPVTASFAPGRMTAVAGPSGSGKTTLLELIAGLQEPTGGQVELAGCGLDGLGAEDRAALRRVRIGYLAQEPSPAGFLSALETVVLALAVRGRDGPGAAQRAASLLVALGLAGRAGQRVGRLSAGEAQRVALAAAVAGAGGVLIADEPTSRLDRESAGRVIRMLLAAAAAGHTVICATHDPEVVAVAAEVVALGSDAAAPAARSGQNDRIPSPTPPEST